MFESGWRRKNHPNMMFFWYEELKEDQMAMIKKIRTFLGLNISDEKIEQLNEFLKFENFSKVSMNNKKNPNWHQGRGQFLRKGLVGDWHNHFTPSLNQEFDVWISSNLTRLGIQSEEAAWRYQGLEN